MNTLVKEPHRSSLPNGRALQSDAWGFDPFRNFFSALSHDLQVNRTEKGYVVEIPVAGFKPEQVEVTYKDQVLTVVGKGDRRAFTRSLIVPEEIDADNIEARVEHGLLSLTMPRIPEAEPKRIAVS